MIEFQPETNDRYLEALHRRVSSRRTILNWPGGSLWNWERRKAETQKAHDEHLLSKMVFTRKAYDLLSGMALTPKAETPPASEISYVVGMDEVFEPKVDIIDVDLKAKTITLDWK